MTTKYYILDIWGEKQECSIVEQYDNNTIRIHIPQYNKGRYIGYRESTIDKGKLIIE